MKTEHNLQLAQFQELEKKLEESLKEAKNHLNKVQDEIDELNKMLGLVQTRIEDLS